MSTLITDYAKTGRAACKNCKEKLEKGALRAGKKVSASSSKTDWYHVKCLFESLSSDAKPKAKEEIQGISELKAEDQQAFDTFIQAAPASAQSSKSDATDELPPTIDEGESKSPETKRAKLAETPQEEQSTEMTGVTQTEQKEEISATTAPENVIQISTTTSAADTTASEPVNTETVPASTETTLEQPTASDVPEIKADQTSALLMAADANEEITKQDTDQIVAEINQQEIQPEIPQESSKQETVEPSSTETASSSTEPNKENETTVVNENQ